MKFSSVFGGIILLLVLGIDFNNGANATEGTEGYNKNSICNELCEVCDEYFPTRLICYENLLQHICLDGFSSKVEALNTSDLCIWDKIKWLYDSFTKCTEEKADCLKIPWPNQLVEDMFVDIHATHFKSCPVKEFDDPPPDVLLALVMTPICLIPAMVMLVVVKTKNRNQNFVSYGKAETMGDSVVYTEVKFTKEEEHIKPRKMVFSTLKSHSLSKVTWILVFAVLILLIVVVGMTIEIVRLHKGSRCSGLSPQPDRNGCDLPSNGQAGMTALGEIPCNLAPMTMPPDTLWSSCKAAGDTTLVITNDASSSGPPCPFDWLLHKGQCYLFSREEQDRQSALRSCSSNSSQLADTEDLGILNFLRQHMGKTFYWIGLNKTEHDSRWLWTGGRPLNRTHYFNNTDHHNKNCAEVSIDKIYAETCTLKKRYICEKKAS